MLFTLSPNKSHYLLLCVLAALSSATAISHQSPDHRFEKRQTSSVSPLVNFQVYEPVLTPTGPSNQNGCVFTELLMDYVFGFSYGKPFVGIHTPPPCNFNRVSINFTVTSKGRQFDRLGLMYLGDVEVFRTSTAEPTANGIVWTYIKEMDQYDTLWKTEQKIIFDLGNLIDSTYTGSFDTTLTATFFTVPGSRRVADQIWPISAKRSGENMPSAFTLPADDASTTHQFPQNVERAVVSMSACGQATEEFWYNNVFQSQVNTFEDSIGTLYGYSPFREVQLLIDGQLAGVSWPFPIIFTGGIAPGLWRPVVGIDAFDLRQQEIDVSPWLPLLCDGASHAFEIRVTGLNDDGNNKATLSGTTGSNWVVTGTIFLFLAQNMSMATGSAPIVDAPRPSIQISSFSTKNATGANDTLTYKTTVSRDLTISSSIKTSSGQHSSSWSQQLSYTNFNVLSSRGYIQYTQQSTTGTDSSSSTYSNRYSYPLTVNSSFIATPDGSIGINATLSRGLDLNITGPSVLPSGIQNFNITSVLAVFAQNGDGQLMQQPFTPPDDFPFFSSAVLSTQQEGEAKYLSAGNRSYSFGTTRQTFRFAGVEVDAGVREATVELYRRNVDAVNTSVRQDEEILFGETFSSPGGNGAVSGNEVEDEVGFSVRALLGRGPGKTKEELAGVERVVRGAVEVE
ncbi:MAG: hypothetical protein LQ342_005617 [Letrouitia transgressa]|nr:MAG: hypothetical protein LQ342_005617 [Letrouitia transgressa]